MKEYVNTFLHYRFLLGELVKKGIKLKYRRSYLGIVWSLLEPLLTMIVLTIVFGTLFGNKDRTFPVYILTGRLLWNRNDSCDNWSLFQGYGVFVVSSTDDHYVYLCNFLLSVQTFEEWFCMDTEIQSIVLHNQYFSFCHVWRNDEYPLFCICAGL